MLDPTTGSSLPDTHYRAINQEVPYVLITLADGSLKKIQRKSKIKTLRSLCDRQIMYLYVTLDETIVNCADCRKVIDDKRNKLWRIENA